MTEAIRLRRFYDNGYDDTSWRSVTFGYCRLTSRKLFLCRACKVLRLDCLALLALRLIPTWNFSM